MSSAPTSAGAATPGPGTATAGGGSSPAATPVGRELAEAVRAAATALGFVRVGFTTAEPFTRGKTALERWLAAGNQGEMSFMAAHSFRADPRGLLPEARSIIVVALPYPRAAARAAADDASRGIVARYARGADYHLVLREKLEALATRLSALAGRPVKTRSTVDSAPILEREAAARAGVGFLAVSTMTIVPGIGTYVLLGELLTDLELPPDAPLTSRCGSCNICVAACPTGAITGPFTVDARRCISYLTIEHKGAVDRALRPLMGRRVFGCDLCQEVCPFNGSKRPKPEAPELAPLPELDAPELERLLTLGSGDYKRLVAGTAFHRTSRNQLARNAAIALGNAGDRRAVPALARVLADHVSPLVRGHAAWALGRLGGPESCVALARAAAGDGDATVRDEAALALAEASAS